MEVDVTPGWAPDVEPPDVEPPAVEPPDVEPPDEVLAVEPPVVAGATAVAPTVDFGAAE
jgi:hypothetical protein